MRIELDSGSTGSRTAAARSDNRVVDGKHDHGAEHGNHDAVKIEPLDAMEAQQVGNKSPHHGADNSENDVAEKAFTLVIDEQAGNKAGN